MKHIALIVMASLSTFAYSQDSPLLLKYREMALEYNHDLKSAQEHIAASIEVVEMSKADLKPKLGANASYQYKGKPIELNMDLPMLETPLHLQGQNNQYSVSAILSQPIYSGGRLIATLKKSEQQLEYAQNEALLLKNAVSQQSDITYWNSVARGEIVSVVEESKRAVEELVKIVRQRVELGYADPNDLLMTEVNLNDTEYRLQQAKTSLATSVMSLNSLIGIELGNNTELDNEVKPITSTEGIQMTGNSTRPEQLMARNQISISESEKKIANSKYLPQFNIGAEGLFQSPAYDFSKQFKPNYGIYAKISVPIFEWNKRGKESRIAQSRINIASQNLQKIDDKVNLEISTARLALLQAIEQVNLTHNSLSKAFENEKSSTERYTEGRLSIMEVHQAQLFRQNAQINYIQAKVAAQNSWCELQRALNLYNL